VVWACAVVALASTPALAQDSTIAVVGATIIDGNGGAPLADGTILVQGKKIVAVGPRASVRVPAGARVIDAQGKFVTPGFIDTNVHHSIPGPRGWNETYARYWDLHRDLVLQGMQLQLKYGITTIRDSYGALLPGIAARDAIRSGEEIGPRMYVAGNIVGWGGPYSATFANLVESELTLFEEQINDFITQGSGEEWMHMTPDELRVAVNKYLDLGPDFIKYGATAHTGYPSLIGFSPRAQRVIVEETHKRGKVAEVHATSLEGLRLAIEAGIDLIQHPEVVGNREITDELVRMIADRQIVCSMLTNTITGPEWKRHTERRAKALEAQKNAPRRRAAKTGAELRREQGDVGRWTELRRENAIKLIRGGCITTIGTDNLLGVAPEFRREEKLEYQEPGLGSVIAIEGLVELGMTPAEAIVAATRNGAVANKALDEYGTLEIGKSADLLVLTADPLADIRNIRKLELVMVEGRAIDPRTLPTKHVYHEW
jgi:imidazolonepropionase-like amidohydrolase